MPLDGVLAANHRDTYRNSIQNPLCNYHSWRRCFDCLSHILVRPLSNLLPSSDDIIQTGPPAGGLGAKRGMEY